MPSSGVKKCARSEEHTSELQSHDNLVCRLLLEKKERGAALGHVLRAAGRPPAVTHAGGGGRGPSGGGAPLRVSPGFRVVLAVFLFFFNNPGTTEFYPFPPPAAFPT